MNRLSSLLQFIVGFFLGIGLLMAGTAALGFIFFSRLAAPPPKPIFTEERPETPPVAQSPKPPQPEEADAQPPPVEPSPEPAAEELPPGAYKARVNWSEGLSLRAEPSREAERIGGVAYNTEIVILEASRDGDWEKVRLPGSEQEGWIKAGNVEKIDGTPSD